jgi:hypothetical protein
VVVEENSLRAKKLELVGQIPRSQSPRTLQHPSVRSTRCDITAFVYVCFQRPTVLDIKVRNLEHGNSTVFVSIRRRAADLFILKKEIFVRSVCLVRRVCCWVSLNVSQSAHAFCLLEFPTFFIARVPDTSTAVIYRINFKKKRCSHHRPEGASVRGSRAHACKISIRTKSATSSSGSSQ